MLICSTWILISYYTNGGWLRKRWIGLGQGNGFYKLVGLGTR